MPYYDTVSHILQKKLVAPTGSWIALRYDTTNNTNAPGRKYIGVFNRSGYKIFITTDNSKDGTSNSDNPAHTRAIKAGGERIFPYADSVTVYARSAGAGGATLVVTEECG